MMSGLPMMILFATQAAAATPAASSPAPAPAEAHASSYGPAAPPMPKPKAVLASASDPCKMTEPKDVSPDTTREIVVCAPRVEGYRIDPDVLEAQRAKKNHTRPRRPERLVDRSCETVGPMGCRDGAGINLLAAAVTAATM